MGPDGRLGRTAEVVELDEKPVPQLSRRLRCENRFGRLRIAGSPWRDAVTTVEASIAGSAWLLRARGRVCRRGEVGSIEVVPSSNADE